MTLNHSDLQEYVACVANSFEIAEGGCNALLSDELRETEQIAPGRVCLCGGRRILDRA